MQNPLWWQPGVSERMPKRALGTNMPCVSMKARRWRGVSAAVYGAVRHSGATGLQQARCRCCPRYIVRMGRHDRKHRIRYRTVYEIQHDDAKEPTEELRGTWGQGRKGSWCKHMQPWRTWKVPKPS